MKRMPAFTLLEAVLSLFLVLLIGGFTVYVVQALQHGARALRGVSEFQQELIFFNTALRTDLDQAHQVTVAADGGVDCLSEEGLTHYAFFPRGIRRERPSGDTTLFSLPVQWTDLRTLSEEVRLVNLVRIQFEGPDSLWTAYYKNYAPADQVRERTRHAHQDTGQP
ncbi:MAG: hypothetical protein JNJ91_12715 [Flavobacteriales bacterium]|nr:hypothetical protein [Flavobacteriales bacterium]